MQARPDVGEFDTHGDIFVGSSAACPRISDGCAGRVETEILERLDAVLRRTASKRSTLYAWIARGLFPPPVRIGPRRVAWRKRDVDVWIAQAIARGRAPPEG